MISSACSPPVVSTTNTSTAVGGRIEHALVVAGQQRAVDTEREADARRRRVRRGPRRGRRSDRRHRARSAPSRACRPGTRRSCGGSSRGRARAAARRRTGCRASSSPACTVAKCSAAASDAEVGDRRRGGDDRRGVVLALGVEHAQRVPCRASRGSARTSSIAGRSKCARKRVDVAGPVVGLAEAVDDQARPGAGRAAGRTPTPRAITSTSRYGSSAPSTSMPTWSNWR